MHINDFQATLFPLYDLGHKQLTVCHSKVDSWLTCVPREPRVLDP